MRERERVEQELRVARTIQQASLPKEVPKIKGWQISYYYQPAREVGGGFYDFHLLSEGRLGLVVGDATGKGVPAALVMSTTCGMLQHAAQALDSTSPGEVLERVNEALLARIPQHVRDLLLRHPRPGERWLELRQRRPRPALPVAWWLLRGAEGKRDAPGAYARDGLRGGRGLSKGG
jgi:stage II sporulation SpoE-like protein